MCMFSDMDKHPVVILSQKVASHYEKEIAKHWKSSTKKRAHKLYQLIVEAKNIHQLEKELLFKKLFTKSLTDKNDYLWRNELRVLKEELQSFLVEMEHHHNNKNNPAYTDWLLIKAYDRMRFQEGIKEQQDTMRKQSDEAASYPFTLDADVIALLNFMYAQNDMKKMLEGFPTYLAQAVESLNQLNAQYLSRLNSYIAQYNLVSEHHQNSSKIELFNNSYSIQLPASSISNFFNHYAFSFSNTFEEKIDHLEKALIAIAPIAAYNKTYQTNETIIKISLGRELSANGFFEKAHTMLFETKALIDEKYPQYRTAFYSNYITNLTKSKRYEEALYVMDNEFETDNAYYQSMLLQNRLLCYLYLRDTKNLEKYISYDLDSAPFPINYTLKLIKSYYFYQMKEYDVALQIVSNLLQTKDATDRMVYYQPIAQLYKKFYQTAQKNITLKKWLKTDIAALLNDIERIEETSLNEVKLVSVFLWIKVEINAISAK
jgi:hypothetical protein